MKIRGGGGRQHFLTPEFFTSEHSEVQSHPPLYNGRSTLDGFRRYAHAHIVFILDFVLCELFSSFMFTIVLCGENKFWCCHFSTAGSLCLCVYLK